jgi:hypothetical protein
MKSKHFNNTGQFETYLVAALLIFVTLTTLFFKEWFIEPTGRIEIFGKLGVVLAIGLIYKWKYAREILSFLSSVACISTLMIFMFNGFSALPFLALSLMFGLCFYLLAFSRNLAAYSRG